MIVRRINRGTPEVGNRLLYSFDLRAAARLLTSVLRCNLKAKGTRNSANRLRRRDHKHAEEGAGGLPRRTIPPDRSSFACVDSFHNRTGHSIEIVPSGISN